MNGCTRAKTEAEKTPTEKDQTKGKYFKHEKLFNLRASDSLKRIYLHATEFLNSL